MSRLKICFIAGIIGSGGAERQLYYTLKTLHEHGISTRLLYLTDHNWTERFQNLGIPVACVGQSSFRAARVARIVSELRHDSPHVIHSWHFYTNLYAVAAARALGSIEVGDLRLDAISEVREMGRMMGRLSLWLPRVLAANSRGAIDNAIALGAAPDRLRFLPNVVDTDVFRPTQRSSTGPVRIVLVARLAPGKRPDRFLSVLARVRAQSTREVVGIIVGHDFDHRWPALEAQAAELGLMPDGVEFRGPVQDMLSVYREADVIALTSDSEGTPNAVMEAMAAALPVVATRVGGVPDLIQHGRTGFLADPNDEDGLVSALLRLVENPGLRMDIGRQAREHIQATHSLQRLFGSLTELYEAALCPGIKPSLGGVDTASVGKC